MLLKVERFSFNNASVNLKLQIAVRIRTNWLEGRNLNISEACFSPPAGGSK